MGFHLAILLSLLLARSSLPVTILFTSNDIRWVILSILLCGSSGISLYFFWSYFGVVSNLPAHTESLGLTRSTWPVFLIYFVLVLLNRMQTGAVIYSLIALVLAGWFWRQLARIDRGLLAPVLGHMAADFTILMAVYGMSTS